MKGKVSRPLGGLAVFRKVLLFSTLFFFWHLWTTQAIGAEISQEYILNPMEPGSAEVSPPPK